MRPSALLTVSLLAATLGLPATAQDDASGHLLIGHPYIIAPLPGATGAAGYFTVTNEGAGADSLLAVRAGFADASIHDSVTNDAGVTSMIPVERLAVPAGGSVTLEPRGLHVMFMGLTAPLKVGDELPVTLIFEKAGEVAVDFDVEARGAGGQGMGTMDHGAMPMDHKAMGH